MIKFKITRDQARMIEERWLQYMILTAKSNLNNNAGNDGEYLNCKIIVSLLQDVHLKFKQKLLTSPVKLLFNISEAHGSAFYVYLMRLAIDVSDVYAINFRQQLCDALHRQLFANRPPAHESVPLTINDFI